MQRDSWRSQFAIPRNTGKPFSAAGNYAGSGSARGQRDSDYVTHAGDQQHCMGIDEPGSSVSQSHMLDKTVALIEALDTLKPLIGKSREEINRVTVKLGHGKGDDASVGSNVQTRKDMEELKDNYEKMGRENAELKIKLENKNNDYQRLDTNEISRLQDELRKATDTEKSIRTERKEVCHKYKQATERMEELDEVVKHDKECLATMAQECESLRTKLSCSRDQCKQREDKMKKMEMELSDCKTRLSRLLASKVTDNNPDIVDLSDQNRPTKLAEKYSELYDNQWTDAFEAFEKRYNDEQKSIEELVRLLQDIKRHCDNMAKDQVNKLQDAITLGLTVDEWPIHVFKQLKDLRKITAGASLPIVFQKYLTDHASLGSDERVQPFVKECVELCWLMSVQDPPFAFGPTPKSWDILDTNAYKFYTQSGPAVAYLVWPALHLHEGGPILSKGVLQGCGTTSQSNSAKRSSRDSPRIKSSSGRPQTAPSVQAMSRSVMGSEGKEPYKDYDNASSVLYTYNVQHQHKNDVQSAVRDTNPTAGTSRDVSKTTKETEGKNVTDQHKKISGGSQRPADYPGTVI